MNKKKIFAGFLGVSALAATMAFGSPAAFASDGRDGDRHDDFNERRFDRDRNDFFDNDDDDRNEFRFENRGDLNRFHGFDENEFED